MIKIFSDDHHLGIHLKDVELRPEHQSQLAFWGLQSSADGSSLEVDTSEINVLLAKLIAYFEERALPFELDTKSKAIVDFDKKNRDALEAAIVSCSRFKEGSLEIPESEDFLNFLNTQIERPLKDHQVKAALHLLNAENGANFSVPGSGKTSVVLSVYEYLRQLGEIDSLFVVGPLACFAPWRDEYLKTLGTSPTYELLAGGKIDERRNKYLVNRNSVKDLYLTTFQTLQNDWEQVQILLQRQGIRFFLVLDEAHYIKRIDGAWAEAVLNIAEHAERRCILTGTPFPRSFTDAFNLFDFLWPSGAAISIKDRHRISIHTQQNDHARAAEILDENIGPLFYRVRKADLHLAPQRFNEPTLIQMNPQERFIYDSILDRIHAASQDDFSRNFDLISRLRRGRMIRLRQCISYIPLLSSALEEYDEDLIEGDLSLADRIKRYDELETPAKLEMLGSQVNGLKAKQQKVVIWSNFIGTLNLIVQYLESLGHVVRLIYGGTPSEKSDSSDLKETITREHIIREFVDPNSSVTVLVANPAACAESISLHTACSHAIYYDLSYNCAQYLQSLDRIHRVGGSETKEAHYFFLQYENSIDQDILKNVKTKSDNMSSVIDKDYAIYSLDMFSEDEEQEAYERLFGNRSEHI